MEAVTWRKVAVFSFHLIFHKCNKIRKEFLYKSLIIVGRFDSFFELTWKIVSCFLIAVNKIYVIGRGFLETLGLRGCFEVSMECRKLSWGAFRLWGGFFHEFRKEIYVDRSIQMFKNGGGRWTNQNLPRNFFINDP